MGFWLFGGAEISEKRSKSVMSSAFAVFFYEIAGLSAYN